MRLILHSINIRHNMRTITIEKKIFKYDELSERAKDHARMNHARFEAENYDPNDDEGLLDKEGLFLVSYKVGTWDTNPVNASFSEVRLDITGYIKSVATKKDLRNLGRACKAVFGSKDYDISDFFGLSTQRTRNGFRTTVDLYGTYGMKHVRSLVETYATKIEEHIKECEYLAAKAIDSQIEYFSSEECIQEASVANDYEYDENGELI